MQIFKRHFSSSVNEWSNHCWPKWCTQLKLRDIILTLTLKCESRKLAECQTWWHLYHPLVCISTFSKLPRDKKEISTLNSKDKIRWKGYWLVKNHFSHRCNRYLFTHSFLFLTNSLSLQETGGQMCQNIFRHNTTQQQTNYRQSFHNHGEGLY